jgi:hypothetical protein
MLRKAGRQEGNKEDSCIPALLSDSFSGAETVKQNRAF